MSSIAEIGALLSKKELTLGSVESFTGGLFASEVTAISGASKYFKGALVTYATEEKVRLLGIPSEEVEKHGVVSKEIAYLMAKLGKEKLAVDYCLAFTGNAGPEAMENKPVGEIYIALAGPQKVEVQAFHLQGERNKIQKSAIDLALTLLTKTLQE